ncbi:MAG: hypothetical protein IJ784_04390 [Ruminiclostridium sp.]|nr:hypothetical protein [Ruminiclostridium sp.]
MNKNDFYKELFERYALDEEKIRQNALKAAKTPAWKRAVSTHWKTAVGAAAAVAVTVGAVTYIAGQNPVIDIVPSETMLSASQRLKDAENNYMNTASENEGMTDIYVSFAENVCYSDMKVSFSAVPDADDITVEALYLSDGTLLRGRADIDAYAETNAADKAIAGAKLYAPAKCLRDIWDLSSVNIAELASQDLNDDTFVPIADEDPLRGDSDTAATTAAPEVPASTTEFSFVTEKPVSETTYSASVQLVTSESAEDPELEDPEQSQAPDYTETEGDDTTQPAETDEPDIVIEETDEPDETAAESDVSAVTEAPQTSESEISVSVTEISDAPDIGLMTQVYQLNVENALDTILVGNYAVVLNRNAVYCYSLGGLAGVQPKVCEISNPKAAYTDNGNVIITGCGQDGLRNVIVVLDTASGIFYSSDVRTSLGESEIGTINYAAAEGKFFLKAVSSSKTYIYEITPNAETGIQFRPLFEYSGAVSLAGYRNNRLWFTAADENLSYSLYSFDCTNGALRTDYTFKAECKIRRSASFDSFIVSVNKEDEGISESFVYDVSREMLIKTELGGESAIAVKHGNIYIGTNGKNYTLNSDGSLTETNVRIDFAGKPATNYNIYSTDAEKVVVSEKHGW